MISAFDGRHRIEELEQMLERVRQQLRDARLDRQRLEQENLDLRTENDGLKKQLEETAR